MTVSRRTFLAGASALALGSATRVLASTPKKMPTIFLPHSPYIPNEPHRITSLSAWSAHLPRPSGIIAMTPHFGSRSLVFGPSGRARVLYNVGERAALTLPQGLTYPSPPDDELAARAAGLLGLTGPLPRWEKSGLEHTVWMPLLYLFPDASVPVLQISYPLLPNSDLVALGRRLAPLRAEGVLFLGSGGLSHNLGLWGNGPRVAPPAWIHEFDQWAGERLLAQDVDALVDFRNKAPAADLNHPDDGAHYKVMLFALGAGLGTGKARAITFPEMNVNGMSRSLQVD